MAGVIQSAINQGIGSIAGMAGLNKIIKEREATNQQLSDISKKADTLNDIIREAKPVYEGHEAGYKQGLQDIQDLYDPETGNLNEAVMQDVLTNPAYKNTTARATVEAIRKIQGASAKSQGELDANQLMTAFQNLKLKNRSDFLRQAQHYQSKQKREEQHKSYEEGKK